MPQPTGSDLHVDSLLSNMSIAYMNEPSSYVADTVFPVVRSEKRSDKYAKYRKADWFRDDAQKRAPLTESQGGGFGMEDPVTFYCHCYAHHMDLDDDDVQNADDVFDLEDDATSYNVEKIRINRERRFATTFFGTSLWGTDLQGQTDTPSTNEFLTWDSSNSTPITDIDGAKRIVRENTGLLPNTLLVAERVHMTLKNHSDVLDRFKYTQKGIITEALLASVFEIDRYIVGRAVYATSKEGQTADLDYVLNQYGALLLYVNPRPSKRRPSAGYTFRWMRPRIAGREGERLEATTRKFYMKEIKGTRVETEVYEEMKLVASDCGVFFNNCIAAGRTITS